MSSDVCTGFEIVSEDSIKKWQSLLGPTDAVQAKVSAPSSIRAAFGTDHLRNAVHASSSAQQKRAEMDVFFGELGTTALLNNCTCCVIKPHIVKAGLAGQIIDTILEEGFEISAMQMFNLDRPTAEEFLEIYRGVLPEFIAVSEQMTTGPCIALEIRQENAVQAFRDLCGPMDPEIAKNLRPKTLRARFGIDRTRNAVHCTDLAEDGVRESEYWFQLQQQ